jgi:hypothetical protein
MVSLVSALGAGCEHDATIMKTAAEDGPPGAMSEDRDRRTSRSASGTPRDVGDGGEHDGSISGGGHRASSLSCPQASTLHDLVICIGNQIPGASSEGYVPPTAAQQLDFRGVVTKMLNGYCDFSLPPSIAAAMRLRVVTDKSDNKPYCVLMEAEDADGDAFVDLGWGAFIVDPAGSREVIHEAPHPRADLETEVQAVDIFKGTSSRAFLMGGAHRNANHAPSACDSNYKEADCAHNSASMFYAAVLAINAFYGKRSHVQIQWHGMSEATCQGVDAHASHGLSAAPAHDALLHTLRFHATQYNPAWRISFPGEGSCHLNATDNIAGRFLNGLAEGDVCSGDAQAAQDKFLHIEQHLTHRKADNWIAPIKDTFPVTRPAPPATLFATASKGTVTLSWTASSGASGYDVLRTDARNGHATVIASTIMTTGFEDTTATPGLEYLYAVRARNDLGASLSSTAVYVKPAPLVSPPTEAVAEAQ